MKLLFLFLITLLAVTQVYSINYYVSASGDDNNTGTSVEEAFETFTKALEVYKTGDVIYACGSIVFSDVVTIAGGDKSIVIRGYDREATFNGNESTQLFFVNDGATLTLEGLTVSEAKSDNVGAIRVRLSNLYLTDCNFINNSSTNVAGAIAIHNSDAYIRGCQFESNTATSLGGALYVSGDSGLPTTQLWVENTVFRGNISGNHGGGICFENNRDIRMTMINSCLTENKAVNFQGAAVMVLTPREGSEFNFINVTVTKNDGVSGAVRFMRGEGNQADQKVKIYNSIIYGQTAGQDIAFQGDITDNETAENIEFRNSFIGDLGADANVRVTMITDNLCNANPQLADFNETYNTYPLISESPALGYGEAEYLTNLGFYTDQLKQLRDLTDGKCTAGSTELMEGGEVIPTTVISNVEIAGYMTNALSSYEHLELSGTYKANALNSLETALGNNEEITSIQFNEIPDVEDFTGTFAGVNPNCLIYLPETADEAPIGWKNVIAGSEALTPIVLEDKKTFSCPDEINAALGVTYTRECYTDGGWETIVLPFTPSDFDGFSDYIIESYVNQTEGKVEFEILSDLNGWEANKAYIMKHKTASGDYLETQPFNFRGANGTKIQTVINPDDEFKGTYKEILVGDRGIYILEPNGTYFGKAVDTETTIATVPAFRAYLEELTGSSALDRYYVKHDGNLTGIQQTQSAPFIYGEEGTVIINADTPQTLNIYTIDGRIVHTSVIAAGETTISNLTPGIYIVNNQKVAVK